MITLPPRKDPYKYADELMDSDSQVNDKWGPANCIELKGKRLKELRERMNFLWFERINFPSTTLLCNALPRK